MNKDMIQNIFIGILLGGVILLAGGVYYLAMQVQTSTQGIQRIEQGMMEASQKADDAMMKAEASSMKADEAMMKTEENAMMEEQGGVDLGKVFTERNLTFSYPASWVWQPDTSVNSDTFPGSFNVGNEMVASLSCPDEFTPSPDHDVQTEIIKREYVRSGRSYTAELWLTRIASETEVSWWNTIRFGRDFGDAGYCSLVLDRSEPSEAQRALYESILESVR